MANQVANDNVDSCRTNALIHFDMKVTVYRPKEPAGLGLPKGFLGEDCPTQGDWIQSAKSDQPDGVDPHRLLHQMGRDFLIYSMYHVREPMFMGYAVENFGAACRRLGYSFPLKDTEANWLTYGPAGFEPAKPHEYQFMLRQIAAVFGDKAALEQAKELGIRFTPQPRPSISPEALAERMKAEILDDVRNLVVPPGVRSFAELHDYVDANCYGGTEVLLDELDAMVPDTDEGHSSALAALCDVCNPAHDIVNDWIAAGGIASEFPLAAKVRRKPRHPRER